jgi:hypothetical protein
VGISLNSFARRLVRANSERKESGGDSLCGASVIQAGHWAEASGDGTTIFEGPAYANCSSG